MKYIYEFIGTFFLIFTIGMTILMPDRVGITEPIALGAILTAMVFAGEHVSGAHYNPAVSLSVFLRKRLSLGDLWIYVLVQTAAAVLAGYFVLYFKGILPQPLAPINITRALVAEFLFTFALCHVVLNAVTSEATKGNSYYGIAVGGTILAGAYAIGAVSGAALNPAVAIGMAIMKVSSWSNVWFFLIAHVLGGACAALTYNMAHQRE